MQKNMTNHRTLRQHQLLLSSVPLRKLRTDNKPIGIASGGLVDFNGHRILLSVFHATKNNGSWGIEVSSDSANGTKLYKPGEFHYVGEMKIGDPIIKEVDFSFREVPNDLVSTLQEIDNSGRIIAEHERSIFELNYSKQLNGNLNYGFAGQVLPEWHTNNMLASELRIYDGLKYLRTEDQFHVFQTPVPHPGHEHFQGCSGAPILDEDGDIVALVCSGAVEKNTIYGVSLSRYQALLEVTYEKILNA